MPAVQRILLVGWSAADWRLLDPLLEAGGLPHLSHLLGRGARGNLRTLQPQFVPLLWTSLATGQRADRHGVLNALLPDSERGTRPLSRLDRQCRALWNITESEQSRSIVVNWPATYPAESFAGVCASDLFFRLAGDAGGLEPLAPGATHPPELADSIGDLRFSPAGLTRDEMGFFVPDLDAAEEDDDPMLERLAVALAETVSTHAVAMELTGEDDWRLAMVRYEILDALGAEFMACQPPQLPYIPDRLFERYQGTIPAIYRYLDLMLGTLVEQAGPDTLVLLVSERGVQTGGLRPQDPDTAFRQFGGAPWYREHGIVALAGPGVKAGARVTGAGLLDIAPTVLRCLDMPIGEDMPGRVLLEAFESMPDERSVVSHELQREQGSATARQRLPEAHREAALKRWQETGLLDPRLLEESEPGIEARRQRDFNQAMVALEARRFNRARELLEILHQELHDDDRVALHLARVRRQAGDLDGARALLEGVVDHPDHRPYEQMQLAQIHQLAGDHDRALMHLFRAEQTQGDRPGVHCQIGRVYLAMQRWDDAERAFGKALERDDQHIDSQCGMAETRLGQQRYREAVDAALRAIDLDSTRQQAHYLLGAALLGDGQAEIAAEVFETCLKLNPGHADAHKKLAEACEVLGDTSAAGQHRDIAQKLESAARLQQQLSDYRWKPR